jgi:hypothetical protein
MDNLLYAMPPYSASVCDIPCPPAHVLPALCSMLNGCLRGDASKEREEIHLETSKAVLSFFLTIKTEDYSSRGQLHIQTTLAQHGPHPAQAQVG